MNRTTVLAETGLLLQTRSLARRRGASLSEIIRRALADYVARAEGQPPEPSFVGTAASGGKLRLSERAEELLFE